MVGHFQQVGEQDGEASSATVKDSVVKVATSEDFWRVQVEAIYRRRNYHKLGDVPKLMEKHKGKEAILYSKVCKRYDLNPKKFYADPAAWDAEDKDVKDDGDGETGLSAESGVLSEASGAFVSPPGGSSGAFAGGSTAAKTVEGSGSGGLFSTGSFAESLFSAPPAGSSSGTINLFSSAGSTKVVARFGNVVAGTGGLFTGASPGSTGGLFAASGDDTVRFSSGTGGLFGASAVGGSSKATSDTRPTLGSSSSCSIPGDLFGSALPGSGSSLFDKVDSGTGGVSLFSTGKTSKSSSGSLGDIFGGAPIASKSVGDLAGGAPNASKSASLFGTADSGSGSGSLFASAASGSFAGGSSFGNLFGTTSTTSSVSGPTPGNIFGSETVAATSSSSMFGTADGGSGSSTLANLFGTNSLSGISATGDLFKSGGAASKAGSPVGDAGVLAGGSLFGLGGGASSSTSFSPFAPSTTTNSSLVTASSSGALFGTASNETGGASLFSSASNDGASSLFGTGKTSKSSTGSLGDLFGGAPDASKVASLFGTADSGSGSGSLFASAASGSFASGSSFGNLFGTTGTTNSVSGLTPGNIFGSETVAASSSSSLFGEDRGGTASTSLFGAPSSDSVAGSLFGTTSISSSTAKPFSFGAGSAAPEPVLHSEDSAPPGKKARQGVAKRMASSAVEEEDDGEEADGAALRQKAAPEVLARRKIVKGRRTAGAKPETSEPALSVPAASPISFAVEEPSSASPNPFAGFAAASAPEAASQSKHLAGILQSGGGEKLVETTAEDTKASKETSEAFREVPAGAVDVDAAPVKVETREDFWRVQVEAIYRKRNPYKLEEVPKLLEKYKGKEVVLYKKVCQRYDLDSSKFYTNPEAWASEEKEFKEDDAEDGGSAAAISGNSLFSASSSGSLFSVAATGTGGSLFGTTGSSLFGSGSVQNLFGDLGGSASASSSVFGAATSSSFVFGTGSSGSDVASSFSIFGAAPGSTASGSIFGSSSTGNVGAGLFGSTSSSGESNAVGTSSIFGFGASGGNSGAGASIFAFGAASSGSSASGGSGAFSFGSGAQTPGDGDTNKKKRRAE
ncbi:unnamed protein product [Polarella glacialis]|uniref:Nuclear pore complex NUP2/50/61 domain-containing protein n=2 Tax=Polarella glacialis TaxID=89957 RepID=A0A813LDU0_POLGL|nr:unnamed protein product [Polarella glacialis]